MFAACPRRRNGFALLATMLFLLVAVSFHSAADNDLGAVSSAPRLSLPPAMSGPDRCPACALDGLVSVCPALAVPILIPTAAERLEIPVPASPFVAPRASVDSRPPPTA